MVRSPTQRQIRDLQLDLARVSDRVAALATQPEDAPPSSAMVGRVIAARKLRAKFLSPGLFGEPAWDILLELYHARLSGRAVSATGVGLPAEVPGTTAQRWIDTLEREGFLKRTRDPGDARIRLLTLSDAAARTIEQYFREARSLALFD